MARLDPRRSRWLLGAAVAALFALSAVRDPALLLAAWAAALVAYRRGAGRVLRRVAILVVPLVSATVAATWLWLHLFADGSPAREPLAALFLRATLLAFLTLATAARVDLPGALAPWPAASRVLVIALSQIHALRRLATESAEGFRSRTLRRPRLREAIRNAGGLTSALFALAVRNARETAEALRSREL